MESSKNIKGTRPELPEVSARPCCPYCDKRLRPQVEVDIHPQGGMEYTGRVTYRAHGPFCSHKCAANFGLLAYRGGVRKTGKPVPFVESLRQLTKQQPGGAR